MCEFAALVEIDDGIAAAQVSRYALDDVPVFRTLAEALAAVEADGVINVTPPQFHEEVVCDCPRRRRPRAFREAAGAYLRVRATHRGSRPVPPACCIWLPRTTATAVPFRR